MKNWKKILIVACLAVALVTTGVIASLASDEYAGSIIQLNTLIGKAKEAANDNILLVAYNNIAEYVKESPVDPTTDEYAAALAESAPIAVAYAQKQLGKITASTGTAKAADALTNVGRVLHALPIPEGTEGFSEVAEKFDTLCAEYSVKLFELIDRDIAATKKTASNQIAINRMEAFLENCGLFGQDSDTVYADIIAGLPALVKAQNETKAAIYDEMDSANVFEEYGKTLFMNEKLDALYEVEFNKGEYISTFYAVFNSTDQRIGVKEETNGNKYIYIENRPAAGNAFFQQSLTTFDSSNGLVIEFDFAIFDVIPGNKVQIEPGSIAGSGGIFPPNYLMIDSEGRITDGNGTAGLALENAIVPGKWLHVVLVHDDVTMTRKMYIEGELIGVTNAAKAGTAYSLDQVSFRFSCTGDSGTFAIDNFTVYEGTQYRHHNKINDMDTSEKFLYYVDYFIDESKDSNGRYLTYNEANQLLGAYWQWTDKNNGIGVYVNEALETSPNYDPDVKKAVDDLLSFDIEAMMGAVRLTNLSRYKSMIEELEDIERNPDNIPARKALVSSIQTFALEYSEAIDKEIDEDGNGRADYVDYNFRMNAVSTEITHDENSTLFVRYMNKFQQVTVYTALQRYYNYAYQLIINGEVDISIATDPEHPSRDAFADFVNAYNDVYLSAAKRVNEVNRYENAVRISTCISHIEQYDNEEAWLEHRGDMEKYLDIVKDAIRSRDENGDVLYDDTYPGILECVSYFERAYEFIYNLRQTEHIAYMNGILEKIAATDAYIEKMGMVAMLRRYLADNDINYNNSEIITIVNNIETCEAELSLRHEDYAKILVQNAVYFVNIIEKMRTAETYAEQKQYFDEATLLYYNLDISVEGTREAAALYEGFAVELETKATASVRFLDAVAVLEACDTEDEKYAVLVECYMYSADAEGSYEGVAAAMAVYKSAYDSYMGYAASVNGDISAGGNAVGSLRAICGITPVISAILGYIFG